ncbi:protein pleiotropic regulatory locus 1 isoform X2 [Selaginella moellendorffii]|uniref:protein pleiotropic regulatory locus 1 isoform X2 n=1 Tax=Selaginella moellendorffii TaxID=88036 RepID=UPI000D1CF256|nr:protein pleiotropic regulatory locus 1 isoform X2 [Selaginella moellendorffii]|eukprot:XP_024542527.1 protein pleiotropic regulatory locus 1 isoform X2 [Selaginella moellendorffii]
MPAAMEATQAMDVDEAPLVPPEKPQSIEQLTLASLQQAAEFFGNAPPDPVGAESRRIRTAYKPAALPDASPGQIVRAGPVGPQPAFTPSGTPESGIARYQPSAAVMRRLPSRWPKPEWHAPWKNYRVISAHLGWVRAIAFDPGNEWFCTGSADRTIKIWDTASATLKLTLTGHVEQVRGLAVSPRHPYMFSAGDDKQVKCWDLEYNKVIRSYHGHLSGVYCLTLHPTLDILLTGGRDSVCRVWDMRTKAQIFALSGHDNTVCSVITQATDPQVVTGSHDCTVKLWNLAAGKTLSTLTFHKKSVRALALHPLQPAFASASADNIKKFSLPRGEFVHNMLSQQKAIVNCMALNEENVLVTGGDNGSIWFWDWTSGHNFQQTQTIVQPGSLDAEASIFAASFDITGTRLVTCEADKTIKMWRQDENATPQTHPLNFRPPRDIRRF